MSSEPDRDDALAREVASTDWDRRGELSPVHLGLNRLTWKVGEDLWLTAIDEDQRQLLERESRLLREVRAACSAADVRLDVPEVVPSISGDTVVYREGRAFRATSHIGGVRPDANLAETYRASTLALRRLHPVLREISGELAVLHPLLAEVGELIARGVSDDWSPVTTDPSERRLVRGVAEWLAPRMAGLRDAPAQLIHGDWSTPNLLVDDPRTGRVVAVLDWQCCLVGPVVADIAQAVSGVLMFSQLAVEPVMDSIFATYGAGADRRLLGPAMVAHWFRNYWWAREELLRDERHRSSVDRQPERLRSVMQFAEWLGD